MKYLHGQGKEWDSRAFAENMADAAASLSGAGERDAAIEMIEKAVDVLLGHAANGRLTPETEWAGPPANQDKRADSRQRASYDAAHDRTLFRISGGRIGQR